MLISCLATSYKNRGDVCNYLLRICKISSDYKVTTESFEYFENHIISGVIWK